MIEESTPGDPNRARALTDARREPVAVDPRLRVGVLALQGDVERHAWHLAEAGASVHPVRLPADLDGLAAIILPGGETTAMGRLLVTSGLYEPLGNFMTAKPVLGTCAGMILLASEVDRLPYDSYRLIDITVQRNAWGRQVHSFQEEILWRPPGSNGDRPAEPLKAIFIRAPRVVRVGPSVEVLAEFNGEPVAVRQGRIVALSFHPELTGNSCLHRWFLAEIVVPSLAGDLA